MSESSDGSIEIIGFYYRRSWGRLLFPKGRAGWRRTRQSSSIFEEVHQNLEDKKKSSEFFDLGEGVTLITVEKCKRITRYNRISREAVLTIIPVLVKTDPAGIEPASLGSKPKRISSTPWILLIFFTSKDIKYFLPKN